MANVWSRAVHPATELQRSPEQLAALRAIVEGELGRELCVEDPTRGRAASDASEEELVQRLEDQWILQDLQVESEGEAGM